MSGYLILLIVLALFVVPIPVGNYLARRVRMPDYGWRISLILWSLACATAVVSFGEVKYGIDLSGGVILVYDVAPNEEDADRTLSTEQMEKLIAAIKKRVDPGGVKEVTIRQYGADQIEIIIPEVDAAEAALMKRIIASEGTLEFRILANPRNREHKRLIDLANSEPTARFVKDDDGNTLAWWVPVARGKESNFQGYIGQDEAAVRKEKRGDEELLEILVVKDEFDVTGKYLRKAERDYDPQSGDPCVSFTLDSVGGTYFGSLTGKYRPKEDQDLRYELGIILNDFLQSAPVLRSTIHERGQITGLDDEAEVRELVSVLNAGSLPTALSKEPISELITGPTLGQDTINRGKWAIGVSMLVVLAFMLWYYRFAGMVACLALLANVLLIVAVMITIKAAFTLPGLAGLVLTVGMAVDANVLIFERIREELARGAALRMAIRNGFARATTTIVDANLTTLITATILYIIGTDQVRGFAVTLWLGVVLSMYTAIFCSRVIFDIAERRRWLTELKMLRMLGATSIDFLSRRRVAIAGSLLLMVVGIVGVVVRGRGLLDIDFTGGVSVEVVFDEDKPQRVADIRKALQDELPDLAVSDVKVEAEKEGLRFRINTSQQEVNDVEKTLDAQVAAVYGSGWADEHKAAMDAVMSQFAALLKTEKETEAWTRARTDLDRQIESLFSQAPDAEKRVAAVQALDGAVDRALLTAIELVEGHLHEVFGEKLAHNEMTVAELAMISETGERKTPAPAAKPETKTPAADAPGPAAEPKTPAGRAPGPAGVSTGEPPAQPKSDEGARRDLPPDSLLATVQAGPLWLAQADPSGAEPDAKPEDETGNATNDAASEPAKDEPTEPDGPSESGEPTEPGEQVEPRKTEEPAGEAPPALPAPETAEQPATEPPAAEPSEAEPSEPGEQPKPAGEAAPEGPETTVPPEPEPEPPKATGPEPGATVPGQSPAPGAEAEPGGETAPKPSGSDPFAGGTQAKLEFSHRVDHDTLRGLFEEQLGPEAQKRRLSISNPEHKPGESSAYTEWTVKIDVPPEQTKPVLEAVKAELGDRPFFPSSNTIGGKVAGQTQTKAISALIASLVCIVIYIWIRFQRVVYGVAAVVALVHDVLISLGVIALTYWISQLPGVQQALMIAPFKIGLSELAAFLTIIGYSLNDTIVVFDRIREVKGKSPQLTDAMVNASINQTLSRTLLTSLTTLLVVGILYFGGGQAIHGFAFALVVGVLVGTYSSIFIASPALLWMSRPAKSR